MAILNVLVSFLACVEGLKISSPANPFNAEPDLELDLVAQKAFLAGPLTQDEIDYLQTLSQQKAELEEILKQFQGNSIVFIGDSMMRNQYDGLCLLLGAKHAASEMDRYNGQIQNLQTTGMDKCEGKGISAAFAFTQHPTPTALSELMSVKEIQQPSVIYWDASQAWGKYKSQQKGNYFQLDKFRIGVEQALQAYTKAATDAKMVFFLSHSRGKVAPKPSSVDDQLMNNFNSICRETVQANKDGQGRDIKIVDGFSFTKDKPEFTTDGVHYNKLVFEELKMMFRELQGNQFIG